MERQVFEQLRKLILRESGISLPDEKEQLLANRIQKRLRAVGATSERQYLEILEVDATGEELRRLLDAVSTNVTHFYREERHFEILKDIYAKWAEEGRTNLKLWCAASSSGEEPYTMSMVARETLDLNKCEVKILATDISEKVLQQALQRCYEEKQLEKLPALYRETYFKKVNNFGNTAWRVNDSVANLVIFKRLNLAKFPYPLKGELDCIFCRNVMIYFTRELRQQIIDEFTRLLRPGGYFFLSHSENLLGITHSLKPVSTAVFQKPLNEG